MSRPDAMPTGEPRGLPLDFDAAGPPDGPPVVLLHGFPETRACWSRQVGPLASAGLRLLVPDQRGYGRSPRPDRVADYALDLLADDILRLIDTTGRDRAALVGHDWGGIVAWWVALRNPEKVERLAILNAPHPVAMRHALRTSPGQLLRSWYAFYFQLPFLPERHLGLGRGWLLARSLRKSSRPGAFTEAELEEYRRVWSEPGALRAMIHWYRAAMWHEPTPLADPRVRVPTLILWGPRDPFIRAEVARESVALCDDGRLEFIDDAAHWALRDEPERVNRHLIEFLGGRPSNGAS